DFGDLKIRKIDRAKFLQEPPIEALPVGAPAQMKLKSKRKGRYDWVPVLAKISGQLHANGVPETGDGGQARLEKLAADAFPPGEVPAESVIRARVSALIE